MNKEDLVVESFLNPELVYFDKEKDKWIVDKEFFRLVYKSYVDNNFKNYQTRGGS